MSKPQRQIASIWITVEKRGGGGAARRDGPKNTTVPYYKRDGHSIRIRYYYVLHIREARRKEDFFDLQQWTKLITALFFSGMKPNFLVDSGSGYET